MSDTHNKRRLSFFSFGLNSTTLSQNSLNVTSSSPGASVPHVKTTEASPNMATSPPAPTAGTFDNKKLSSSLLLTYNGSLDLSEKPESSDIFERSVQDFMFEPPTKPNRKPSVANLSRQNSMSINTFIKNEDLIPPALDATTSIFNDKDTNLDDVEMIYSNRRNSSVLGLNMALGRPFTPSRKNSVYSMQLNSPLERTASNLQQPAHQLQPQSPVSPPKLTSSKSSLSFYSYADMINNDEYARRPSFKQSYSQSIVPTVGRKQSVSSNFSPLTLNSNSSTSLKPKPFASQSQLSRQLSQKKGKPPGSPQLKTNQKPATKLAMAANKTSPSKFLISPESSDSEDNEIYYPALNNLGKRKSMSSQNSQLNSILDDESLVSSSIGDCIRQSTTEINGH